MSENAEGTTRDVDILLGNPKGALIAMAVPVMIANLIQSINNIVDTVWLTSLGVEAQAAVNVIFPLFFLTIGFGNGIGVGASQALARRIGAMDRKGANEVAAQAFVMTLIISILLTVVFVLFAYDLICYSGGASNIDACMEYAIPIFIGITPILMGGMFSALLRSEGAAKRSMYIHVLGVIFNMILDPVFIFGFGMGISGAAIATVISMTVPIAISIFWYFGNQSTFVRIPLKGFRFNKGLVWDILRVGIPASMEIILMSVVIMVMNIIIESISPVDGVAIYGNGWKMMDLFFMPTMAIGFAIVPICAAALGAKKVYKIREVYRIALGYGVVICLGIALVLGLFANYLVIPFSYSESTAGLREEMALFITICAVFLPFTPLGYTSVGLFQGLGWGYKSLLVTFVVNISRIPICYLLAISIGSLESIWYGVVIAEIIGSVFGGVFGIYTIRKLMNGGYPKLLPKEEFVEE
ncbi:MATE efflux family protein [methanogenic archaeon mixed culture ISO4-G1]|nr:MATE efflux family protein [methanogenic archaeon mixed culture ISO4-G1]